MTWQGPNRRPHECDCASQLVTGPLDLDTHVEHYAGRGQEGVGCSEPSLSQAVDFRHARLPCLPTACGTTPAPPDEAGATLGAIWRGRDIHDEVARYGE